MGEGRRSINLLTPLTTLVLLLTFFGGNMRDANCSICTNDLYEDIEQSIFEGKGYREIARILVEEEGGSLHAWEQVVRKHCIRHTDWKEYGCPMCSVTGENLLNRWVVEKMLRENKSIREITATREFFALFINPDAATDPTSSETIESLCFHSSVCMRRYDIAKTTKVVVKQDNSDKKEKCVKNEDYRQSENGNMRLAQAVF